MNKDLVLEMLQEMLVISVNLADSLNEWAHQNQSSFDREVQRAEQLHDGIVELIAHIKENIHE